MMNTSRTTLTALAATGVVLAANSALVGSRLFFDPRPFSEIGDTTAHVVYNAVLLGAVGALALLLPRLAAVPGRSGRTLPVWVTLVAALGAYFDGGTRFLQAFMVPVLAQEAPALLDDSVGGTLMYAMVSSWVLFGLGLVAVGVAAFTRRVFSRPAAVLVVLGGLSIPAIGPLSGILLGGALAWAALTARHAAATRSAGPVGSAASVAAGS